jgi:hypothetical protein
MNAIKYLFLTSAIAIIVPSQSNSQELPDFLRGNWQLEGKNQFEQWTKLNDQTMKGVSYQQTDGKILVMEYLEIEKSDQGLVYSATIPGQNHGKTIRFASTRADSIYVFENPQHDFPKFIQYQLSGKNQLKAIVGNEFSTYEMTFMPSEIKEEAQHRFVIQGEFWTRPEYRDGYAKLPTPDSKGLLIIPNRSRLSLEHQSGKLSSRLVIQDARVFGQTKLINNTDNAATQIFEAWIKYDFTPDFSLKTGRQMLNYGDKRLINDRNWNVNGASYDVMMLQYTKNEGKPNFFEGHLAFGSSANGYSQVFAEDYKVSNHKYFSFLWLSKRFSDQLQFNFIDVLTGNQEAGSKHTIHWLNTIGINPIFKAGNFGLEGSAYYQRGKTIKNEQAEAFMWTAKVFYSNQKFRLDLGTDFYSGKAADDATDQVSTFNPLNYAGHGYLGEMDHFITIPSAGLQDHYFKVNWYFNKQLATKLDLHWFDFAHTQSNPSDPEQILGRHAGKEMDFNISYRQSKEVQFTFGYSFFLPTEDYEQYNRINPGESRFAQWAYLSLLFKPTLFEYKPK